MLILVQLGRRASVMGRPWCASNPGKHNSLAAASRSSSCAKESTLFQAERDIPEETQGCLWSRQTETGGQPSLNLMLPVMLTQKADRGVGLLRIGIYSRALVTKEGSRLTTLRTAFSSQSD